MSYFFVKRRDFFVGEVPIGEEYVVREVLAHSISAFQGFVYDVSFFHLFSFSSLSLLLLLLLLNLSPF